MEIYNENVVDLLNDKSKKALEVRETQVRGDLNSWKIKITSQVEHSHFG